MYVQRKQSISLMSQGLYKSTCERSRQLDLSPIAKACQNAFFKTDYLLNAPNP